VSHLLLKDGGGDGAGDVVEVVDERDQVGREVLRGRLAPLLPEELAHLIHFICQNLKG
jgi:hypothetical protein